MSQHVEQAVAAAASALRAAAQHEDVYAAAVALLGDAPVWKVPPGTVDTCRDIYAMLAPWSLGLGSNLGASSTSTPKVSDTDVRDAAARLTRALDTETAMRDLDVRDLVLLQPRVANVVAVPVPPRTLLALHGWMQHAGRDPDTTVLDNVHTQLKAVMLARTQFPTVASKAAAFLAQSYPPFPSGPDSDVPAPAPETKALRHAALSFQYLEGVQEPTAAALSVCLQAAAAVAMQWALLLYDAPHGAADPMDFQDAPKAQDADMMDMGIKSSTGNAKSTSFKPAVSRDTMLFLALRQAVACSNVHQMATLTDADATLRPLDLDLDLNLDRNRDTDDELCVWLRDAEPSMRYLVAARVTSTPMTLAKGPPSADTASTQSNSNSRSKPKPRSSSKSRPKSKSQSKSTARGGSAHMDSSAIVSTGTSASTSISTLRDALYSKHDITTVSASLQAVQTCAVRVAQALVIARGPRLVTQLKSWLRSLPGSVTSWIKQSLGWSQHVTFVPYQVSADGTGCEAVDSTRMDMNKAVYTSKEACEDARVRLGVDAPFSGAWPDPGTYAMPLGVSTGNVVCEGPCVAGNKGAWSCVTARHGILFSHASTGCLADAQLQTGKEATAPAASKRKPKTIDDIQRVAKAYADTLWRRGLVVASTARLQAQFDALRDHIIPHVRHTIPHDFEAAYTALLRLVFHVDWFMRVGSAAHDDQADAAAAVCTAWDGTVKSDVAPASKSTTAPSESEPTDSAVVRAVQLVLRAWCLRVSVELLARGGYSATNTNVLASAVIVAARMVAPSAWPTFMRSVLWEAHAEFVLGSSNNLILQSQFEALQDVLLQGATWVAGRTTPVVRVPVDTLSVVPVLPRDTALRLVVHAYGAKLKADVELSSYALQGAWPDVDGLVRDVVGDPALLREPRSGEDMAAMAQFAATYGGVFHVEGDAAIEMAQAAAVCPAATSDQIQLIDAVGVLGVRDLVRRAAGAPYAAALQALDPLDAGSTSTPARVWRWIVSILFCSGTRLAPGPRLVLQRVHAAMFEFFQSLLETPVDRPRADAPFSERECMLILGLATPSQR